MSKPKILLVEHVLAHYRKDVFKAFLSNDYFDFEIIAGKNYQGIKSEESCGTTFNYLSLKKFEHDFYFLKGAIRYVFSRNPDIIISTGVDFHLIHSLIIFFVFRIFLRKKFYWWSHAGYGNQGRLGCIIRSLIYRSSSGVFVYSNAGRENLVAMKVREQNIVVVNNSLNREDYGFINNDILLPRETGSFSIIFSGRITKAKKVDILIEALKILQNQFQFDFKCVIIGGGDLLQIIKLSKEAGVHEKILFTGEIYGRELHNYFLDADVFVYPGGIGLSCLHALSFGLPVITTDNIYDHGPELELLIPGYNGDMFHNDSPEDLAMKINEWRTKLQVNRNEYRSNCIRRIKELEYLPDLMVNRIMDFLKSRIAK